MDQDQQINNPKVSVIIPVYNTEAYVEDAVRSILNQTLKDIEVIVINDGSTDNSLAIVERLALQDNRINVYSQGNQGLSVTRNIGIIKAKGEYLYFMDSDDILATDAFEKCYSECVDKKLDFIFFDADSFFENNAVSLDLDYKRTHLFEERRVYSGIEMLYGMLKEKKYRASVCLNLIKRKFLEKCSLSFYPRIIHEDELFTATMYLKAKRVSCVHSVFYHRRVRQGSIMTNNFSIKNIESYFITIKELTLLSKSNVNWNTVIDQLIRYILNPAIYNSKGLPMKVKLKIIHHCISFGYLQYIKPKNIIVMLFPFLITIKSVFKKKGQP